MTSQLPNLAFTACLPKKKRMEKWTSMFKGFPLLQGLLQGGRGSNSEGEGGSCYKGIFLLLRLRYARYLLAIWCIFSFISFFWWRLGKLILVWYYGCVSPVLMLMRGFPFHHYVFYSEESSILNENLWTVSADGDCGCHKAHQTCRQVWCARISYPHSVQKWSTSWKTPRSTGLGHTAGLHC